jgi:hypothetical protein
MKIKCCISVIALVSFALSADLDSLLLGGCNLTTPPAALAKKQQVNPLTGDSVTMYSDSSYFYVHTNLSRPCCIKYASVFRESGDTLYFAISDTCKQTDRCYCYCYCRYSFTYRMNNVENKLYRVYIRSFEKAGPFTTATVCDSMVDLRSTGTLVFRNARMIPVTGNHQVYDIRGRAIARLADAKNGIYIVGNKRIAKFR